MARRFASILAKEAVRVAKGPSGMRTETGNELFVKNIATKPHELLNPTTGTVITCAKTMHEELAKEFATTFTGCHYSSTYGLIVTSPRTLKNWCISADHVARYLPKDEASVFYSHIARYECVLADFNDEFACS